jgi:ATP-dependent Clp protease ATP-binding subunit ClpC
LEQAKIQWEEDAKTKRFPMSEEDIAEVVAMMTGIPVKKLHNLKAKRLGYNG